MNHNLWFNFSFDTFKLVTLFMTSFYFHDKTMSCIWHILCFVLFCQTNLLSWQFISNILFIELIPSHLVIEMMMMIIANLILCQKEEKRKEKLSCHDHVCLTSERLFLFFFLLTFDFFIYIFDNKTLRNIKVAFTVTVWNKCASKKLDSL